MREEVALRKQEAEYILSCLKRNKALLEDMAKSLTLRAVLKEQIEEISLNIRSLEMAINGR